MLLELGLASSGVVHGAPQIYLRVEDGFPKVYRVGPVQLAEEGSSFFYPIGTEEIELMSIACGALERWIEEHERPVSAASAADEKGSQAKHEATSRGAQGKVFGKFGGAAAGTSRIVADAGIGQNATTVVPEGLNIITASFDSARCLSCGRIRTRPGFATGKPPSSFPDKKRSLCIGLTGSVHPKSAGAAFNIVARAGRRSALARPETKK